MIEIALMLAGAETAISTIKKAIAIGRDAHECLGDFMALFDAADAVNRASANERSRVRAKNEDERSAMSEAMESVIAARKIQQMMTELQEYLVYSGQADVWEDIMRERNAVIARRKAEELAAKRAAEKRRGEISEAIDLTLALVAATAVLVALIWGGMELLDYCKTARCGK